MPIEHNKLERITEITAGAGLAEDGEPIVMIKTEGLCAGIDIALARSFAGRVLDAATTAVMLAAVQDTLTELGMSESGIYDTLSKVSRRVKAYDSRARAL